MGELLSVNPGLEEPLSVTPAPIHLWDLDHPRFPRVPTLTLDRVVIPERPYLGTLGDPTVINVFAAPGQTVRSEHPILTHGWISTLGDRSVSCGQTAKAPSG